MSTRNPYELPRFTGRIDHLFANRRRVLIACLLCALPFLVWQLVFGGPAWAGVFVVGAATVAVVRAITPNERWDRSSDPAEAAPRPATEHQE